MIGPVVTAVGGGAVPSSNDDLIALGARARLPLPKQVRNSSSSSSHLTFHSIFSFFSTFNLLFRLFVISLTSALLFTSALSSSCLFQPFPQPSPPYRAGTPPNTVNNNSSNPNLHPGVKRNTSALGPLPGGGASSTPISPTSSIPPSLHQDKRLKTMPGQLNEATIQAALEEELATLNSALERDDVPKLTQMTEEALSILRNTFAESDKHSYLTILYIAKKRPQLFLSQKKLCDSFLHILSKDFVHLFKRNPVLPILACNVLHTAFDSRDAPWPLQLVQIYLDDALHERVWVDDDHTALFVENILTAFSPKDDSNEIAQIREQQRHIQLLQQQKQVKQEKPLAAFAPGHTSNGEDEFEDEIIEEEVSGGVLPSSSTPALNNSTSADEMEEIPQMPTVPLVRNRFDAVTKEKAKELALGLLQQHLQQLHDNPRNVIKLLTATR
jgi:hypothetical protein